MKKPHCNKYDIVVIGGGASGLFCAAIAGQKGFKALIIEKSPKIGEKIRISGGGRCNFTNLDISPENYLSHNPKFCISALNQYSQYDFIELIKSYNIKFHEKTLGQLFCDESSKLIINMLLDECRKGNVEIQTKCEVKSVHKLKKQEKDVFELALADEDSNVIFCDSLVIASGGLSIPKIGASGFGYDIARQFGHNIISCNAALVPFVSIDADLAESKKLAGSSCEVEVSYANAKFREAILFTHRGLSGPAILQISSYWAYDYSACKLPVIINFCPNIDVYKQLVEARVKFPKQSIRKILGNIVPKKIAEYLCDNIELEREHKNIADYNNKDLEVIAQQIHGYKYFPFGSEGYKTAEVTIGGVDTRELSSQTMESKLISNLYFIGESVDVTGWLGGYNFQWAWSSAYACANNLKN